MNLPAFFAGARPIFGGELSQHQVDCLSAILKAWEQYGDGNPRHLAYILATAKHESANFKFLKEIWGPTAAQRGYEGRDDLGNSVKGDGKRFMGRGFVQITGRRNYADWSKRLGIDLLSKPSTAEDITIAARIIVEGMIKGTFTGKKLADFPHDFVESRRVVNGTDRAVMIAQYAYSFLQVIEGAEPAPAPRPVTPDPEPQPSRTNGIIGFALLVLAFIGAIIAAGWQWFLNLIDKVL